jgi:hypothetical protein
MIRIFKILIVVQLLLFTAFRSGGQSPELGFQTGIGTYSMNDLKNFNVNNQGTLPFETEQVSDFPPYLYFRPSLLVRFSKFSVGLMNTFQSTGSRLSAKDYSGEYRLDMKVKANAPGVFAEIDLFHVNKLKFRFSSIIGILFSNLEINEYFALGSTEYLNDTYKFKSNNYFYEPGIDINYPIGRFSIGTFFGYMIQFGDQAFYMDDNKDNVLIDNTLNKAVGPGWNGLRAGIGANWTFKSK